MKRNTAVTARKPSRREKHPTMRNTTRPPTVRGIPHESVHETKIRRTRDRTIQLARLNRYVVCVNDTSLGRSQRGRRGGRCTRHTWKRLERYTKFWSETLTRIVLLDNLRVCIRITLKWISEDARWHCVECFDLAQDRFQCKGFINMVINLLTA